MRRARQTTRSHLSLTVLMLLWTADFSSGAPTQQEVGGANEDGPAQRPVDCPLVPDKDIIDGTPSHRGKWPWVVAIDTDEYGFLCGGTLIDASWVITAAHCVRGAPVTLFAKLGAFNLSAGDEAARIPVSEIIIHERFEPDKHGVHDVALLRLGQPADTADTCIGALDRPAFLYHFTNNPLCWIIGWGRTDTGSDDLSPVLTERRVGIISNPECQRRWEQSVARPPIYASNICVDEGNGTVSACQGDSGSPLHCYLPLEHKWVLAGVSSWGSKACVQYPAVYMRITAYQGWIDRHLTPKHLTERGVGLQMTLA